MNRDNLSGYGGEVRIIKHSRSVEVLPVVVVGAGQAGLAVSLALKERGLRHVVLERGTRIGRSWRERWDSLRLFTSGRYSHLPGLDLPSRDRHPTKDEVADYLEDYACEFRLPVRLDTPVLELSRERQGFLLVTPAGHVITPNVVIATGPYRVPRIPRFASNLSPSILQIHSSAYRNPDSLPVGPTLVVGAGSSGAQIALELAVSRRVILSGSSPGRIPRVPTLLEGAALRTLVRLPAERWPGPAIRSVVGRTDPWLGTSEHLLARMGIERVGRTVGVERGLPVLRNSRRMEVAAVVWCTGFRPGYEWVQLPAFDEHGRPRHHCGISSEAEGLYFIGLRFQRTLGSATILGAGRDAAFIADAVRAP